MPFTLPSPPGRALIPGEVRYLLEEWAGPVLVRSSEFPLVASVDVDEGPALALTHTFGKPHRVYNAPVDSLGKVLDGFRERMVTFTGSSGADFRLGYDSEGARTFASGFDLFQGFRGFLATYAKDHANWEVENDWRPPGQRAPEPTLVLRMLKEQESYSCDVMPLRSRRQDVGNLWSYTAQVKCWGPPPDMLDPGGLSAFFGSVVGAAQTATAFVDSITAYVAYAAEVTNQTTYVGGTLLEPIRAVGRLGEQLTQVAQAGQRLTQLPQRFVSAIFDAAQQGVNACSAFAQTFTFGTMTAEVDAFQRDASNELNDAEMVALAYLGARGIKAEPSPSPASSALGQVNSGTGGGQGTVLSSITSVVVGAFDTTESIVQRAFGNLSQLPNVLALNGMPDPWTLNTGAPVTTGASILLPAGTAGIPSVGSLVGPNDLYGTDLALDLADESDGFGDLIAPGTEPTDFALFTGLQNFDRMVTVRLTTPLGDYAVFPLLGLPLRLGQSNADVSRADIASRTAAQMLRDPRVARVGEISVAVTDGDRYTLAVALHPVIGDGVQVSVPLGG
jgi:hypothetical protein